MTSRPASLEHRWLLAAAAVCSTVWAVALALAFAGVTQHTLALRVVSVSILAYAACATIWNGFPRLLLSPPLHMAGLLLLFYVCMPLLAAAAIEGRTGSNTHALMLNYPGSVAEGIILGLACLCAGVHLLSAALVEKAMGSERCPYNELPRGTGSIAAVCLAVLSAGAFLALHTAKLEAWMTSRIATEVLRAIPVLVAFLAATVICAWCRGPARRLAIGAAVSVLATMTLLLWNQAPVPLLIIYGVGLLYVALSQRDLVRSVLLPLLSAVAALVLVLAVFFALRPEYSSIEYDFNIEKIPSGSAGLVQRILVVAEAKLLQRQAISAGCYQRLAERSLDEERSGDPLYFAGAVVPKVLWPSKPNLSRGSEFAELCGISGAIASGHSESITIVGEPIFEDGFRGLIVAEIALGVLLLGAAVFGLTGGPVRLLVLTALLPWLLAVEQHFAMYVGNVFKMALILLPAALLLQWSVRRANGIARQSVGRGTDATNAVVSASAPLPHLASDGMAR